DSLLFVQAEDGIRDFHVTGVQTCALPIYFEKYTINIDLSGLEKADLEADTGEDANVMLNVSELKYVVDSLKTDYKKAENSYVDNIHHKNTYSTFLKTESQVTEHKKVDNIMDIVPIGYH